MDDGISIIIPIYNTDTRYLDKCIESIMAQSYTNIEIMLINDGSTDSNISTYIEEYSKKSKKIKVINKNNSGVSDTRNMGISLATKKWVMFIDSDDYITQNCLESMIQCANKNTDVIARKNK